MAMAARENPSDTGEAADPVRGLRLTVSPAAGHTTRVRSSAGTLTLADTALLLTREGAR